MHASEIGGDDVLALQQNIEARLARIFLDCKMCELDPGHWEVINAVDQEIDNVEARRAEEDLELGFIRENLAVDA
jgi:hypothetical protein